MPQDQDQERAGVGPWQPITVGAFRLEADRLVLVDDEQPTLASATEVWRWLGKWQLRAPWWAGDLWNIVRARWPEKADQMLAGLPWERETVERFARVCKTFPPAERGHIDTVSINKYQATQTLPQDSRPEVLDAAADQNLTVSEVRQRVRELKRRPIQEVEPEPFGNFRVMVADPDWSKGVDQIVAVPVLPNLRPNAAVFLWADEAHRDEVAPVLEAWELRKVGAFIWHHQTHPGPSAYQSVRHQHLIWAVRGKCPPDTRVPLRESVITIKDDESGVKPVAFLELVEFLYTRGPYLELFAKRRVEREGWSVYGQARRTA